MYFRFVLVVQFVTIDPETDILLRLLNGFGMTGILFPCWRGCDFRSRVCILDCLDRLVELKSCHVG